MSVSEPKAPSLLTIRQEIEEIDRALVFLVAARVEAACSAIRLRSKMDGQLSDAAQEEIVLTRALGWAEQAGLSPALVEMIFRGMLAAGKDRFTSSREPPPVVRRQVPGRGAGRARRPVRMRESPPAPISPTVPVPT